MSIFEPAKTQIDLQTDKALTALKKYRLEKYDRHVRCESVEQKLYELFESVWYSDKVYQYEQNIVTLLALLMRPDVVNAMRQHVSPIVQDDISQMLLKLYDFFQGFNTEYYLMLLEMVEIEFCEDMQKLKTIEAKYKAKLEGCLAEQHALKLKSNYNTDVSLFNNA